MLPLIGVLGSYRQVELIGMAMGSLQLLFVPVAIYTMNKQGQWGTLGADLATTNFGNPRWVALFAANIGAVIMPWMLFYQQVNISSLHVSNATTASPVVLVVVVLFL